MAEIRYLSVADAIALHDHLLERTGESYMPLRDAGLLESAMMRLQMAAHYEDADLIRQAALLAVSNSQAQAFLDGNKRTAYVCCEVFLDINGVALTGSPLEMAQELIAVAERDDDLTAATARFEAWLRDHFAPR